jgi:hypothetical protein
MKWLGTLLSVVLWSFLCLTQKNIEIPVVVKFGNQQVALNNQIEFGDSTLTITTLKFYLTVQDEKGHPIVRLIDWDENVNPVLTCTTASKIFIGTDSLTNVSGNVVGDLDPIHGMYWAWNSGYINFKLEGYWNGSIEQKFEYHIGGYRHPHATIRKIGTTVELTTELSIDLTSLFHFIIQENMVSIMTPGKNASYFANYLATCFQMR